MLSSRPSRSAPSLARLAALALFVSALALAKTPAVSSAALADSMQRKIDHIDANAKLGHPDTRPTVFQQNEINAYFAERRVPKMPEGVKSVVLTLSANHVHGVTNVDFDQLTASRRSANPLLYIFTGTHDAEVDASVEAAPAGMVHVRIESASIDGLPIPRAAMRLFIERYVQPRWPNVALENDYHLPARIDSVNFAKGTGTVLQK
jgi:hypothetical protein